MIEVVQTSAVPAEAWGRRRNSHMQSRLCDALLQYLLRFRRIGRKRVHKSWMVSSPTAVEAQWVRSTLCPGLSDMHA